MNTNFISVPVPANLVSKVYQLLSNGSTSGSRQQSRQYNENENGSGQRSRRGGRSQRSQENQQTQGGQHIEGWTPQLVREAYNNAPKQTKKILRFIASRPNQDVTTEQIAKHVNANRDEVSISIGRFTEQVQQRFDVTKPPFLKRPSGNTTHIKMPRQLAKSITQIHGDD